MPKFEFWYICKIELCEKNNSKLNNLPQKIIFWPVKDIIRVLPETVYMSTKVALLQK